MNKKILGILAVILLLFAFLLINWATNKKELADYREDDLQMESEKLSGIIDVAFTTTSELLTAKGFQSNIMLIDPENPKPYIEVIVRDEHEISSTEKQAVQKLVADAVYSKTNIVFTVTIRATTAAERLDNKWQPIFSAISKGTDKKFEEYRGFAYSFSPAPLQIIIKTDLKSANLEKVEQIEKYVNDIIELKREALSIEELPYKIIVRSKDNEDLN